MCVYVYVYIYIYNGDVQGGVTSKSLLSFYEDIFGIK